MLTSHGFFFLKKSACIFMYSQVVSWEQRPEETVQGPPWYRCRFCRRPRRWGYFRWTETKGTCPNRDGGARLGCRVFEQLWAAYVHSDRWMFSFVDFIFFPSLLFSVKVKVTLAPERQKRGCWMRLTLYHTIPSFNDLIKWPFENTVGKGENAGNQHFLLFPQYFPQCFLPFPKQNSIFNSYLLCCLQMLSIWTSLKFCRMLKC